ACIKVSVTLGDEAIIILKFQYLSRPEKTQETPRRFVDDFPSIHRNTSILS
ncbi:12627_t:CDS:1, partial [Ambispora leptoticha]